MMAYGLSREELRQMMLPRRLELLYRRLAQLEPGHTYVLSISVPETGDDMDFAVLAAGKREIMRDKEAAA